jgi:hypothetical protein
VAVLSTVDISEAVVSSGSADVVIVVTFDVSVASVLSNVDISDIVVSSETFDVVVVVIFVCYYNHYIRCS